MEAILRGIMSYSEEEIQAMQKKLTDLKEMLSFFIEMGENTGTVQEKIRELQQILKGIDRLPE